MPDLFSPFLVFAGIGFVCAAFMAAAAGKRGRRAILVAAAFLVFSILSLAIHFRWPTWVVYLASGALTVLLLADLILRASKYPSR